MTESTDNQAGQRTVDEEWARLYEVLRSNVEEKSHAQTKCACCGQIVSARRRTITSSMARALIVIARAWENQGSTGWVAIKDVDVRGGDYAKLRYWGLLQGLPPDEKDPNQRDSAYWRPTQVGIDFVCGRVSVNKTVCVYNNKAVDDPHAKRIDIFDALGERFDWYKLMGLK